MPKFVLASASPARRRLLANGGISAVVCPSDFDEDQIQAFDPIDLVQLLARHKAETVITRLQREPALRQELFGTQDPGPTVVLGCDSVLLVNGEVYGKPANADEAIARWQAMAGQVGDLYTGHALFDLESARSRLRAQVTRVHFANPSPAEIQAYVATGEPLACAGCFALEGRGGLFVEKIEGCHTNVIGLSMPLLRHLLRDLGFAVTDFWE